MNNTMNTARPAIGGWTLPAPVATLVCILAFPLLPTSATAQVRVTDSNVPFLYESRAAIRMPDHRLASIISKDYRDAGDEFTRHDLLQQLKPVIENRLDQAADTARVFLSIGSTLGDYNFGHEAFPSGMSADTYIRFRDPYQVRFSNAPLFEFIPVPPEQARSAAAALRRSRAVTFRVEGSIASVAEDWNSKVIYMRVDRLVIATKGRRQIAEFDVAAGGIE